MNRLAQELVNGILKEDGQKITAIFGGGFKPPIKGHFNIAKEALKSFPEIDKLLVYVGGGTRDGIEQEEALAIWDIYKEILGKKVEPVPSVAPIGDIMRYAKDHPDEKVYFVIGYREGREDDLQDIKNRTKNIREKYPNLEVKVIKTSDPNISGTNARKALKKGDKETFFTFLPDEVPANEKEEIYSLVNKSIVSEHMAHTNTIDIIEKCAQLSNHMIQRGYNIEPLPGLSIIDSDVENSQDFFGKTAYYDPNEQLIVLYTQGRHPKDIVRSYAHEMIHHIQNLEDRLGNITTTNTDEDDHLDTIEREAYEEGNIAFRNWTDSLQEGFDPKLGKDPFGLNAFAYEMARLGEENLNEGRYDKLTNVLSRIAFEVIKDGHDVGKKVTDEVFVVGPPEEDPDIESNDFEFDFIVQAEYTEDLYSVDGGANAGYDDEGDEIQPLLAVKFKIPKNPDWQTVSFDLKDVVRHELEHLTQDGANVRSGKYMQDDQFIRDMIDADLLPKADYFKLEKEIDAMLQGLYLKAKKSRTPFKKVIDNYLATQPIDNEEKAIILDLWRNRRKALSLPLFEAEDKEKVMTNYTIYSDMDGVLSDFDKRFMQYSKGIAPDQYEKKYGIDKFWELIDSTVGVPFWAGMDWMTDGKQYWDYIKKYDPIILSAPSKNEESKYGKRIWKKRNMPNNKMILVPAWKKQEYASPTSILIDDREKNIQQWIDAGGIGILHTSAASTIAQLKKLGL